MADYGGTLPINIGRGNQITIKLTFEHQGPPFIAKVGAGLDIITDVRILRPDVRTAFWLSTITFVPPSFGWQKQEVTLRSNFSFEGNIARDTVDVLKALQVPFRDLYIDGEKMLLADWDRNVYRIGVEAIPRTTGLPLLSAFGE